MRADRLVATLLVLQARGRVTAAQLAGELEVSVATARRDLEALAVAGIPVYPQPGRGGGWSLVGGARTDLSGLNAAEVQVLFMLAGPSASVMPAAKSALRKLVQALPETFRSDAEAAAAAMVIDPSRWGDRRNDSSERAAELELAVVRRQKVRLAYAGKGMEASNRVVDPWGLVDKDGTWYLLAGTDAGQRTFRLDRILALEMLDEPAERPEGFDLSAAWSGVVGEVEQRRSGVAATVLVDPAWRWRVRSRSSWSSPASARSWSIATPDPRWVTFAVWLASIRRNGPISLIGRSPMSIRMAGDGCRSTIRRTFATRWPASARSPSKMGPLGTVLASGCSTPRKSTRSSPSGSSPASSGQGTRVGSTQPRQRPIVALRTRRRTRRRGPPPRNRPARRRNDAAPPIPHR